MEDREIVAAVAAGDPAGPAGAYDAYAESLHGYCRWMLAEPGDAAQVVQDTFVLAASQLGRLPDPGNVRSWLFGTARVDCLRWGRAGAGFDEEPPGATGSGDAERAELRQLLRSTMAGLGFGEREAVELSVWHDLDDTELAAVLGLSPAEAHALVSSGRGRLERTLSVARTARTGRDACPGLAVCLEGWDGHLYAATLEAAGRHIEHCTICASGPGGSLRPEALRRLLPLAALPPEWREQVLDRCAAAVAEAAVPDGPPAGTAAGPESGWRQRAGRARRRSGTAGGGIAGRAGFAAGWERVRRNPRIMATIVVVIVALAISVPLIAVGSAHAVRNLVAQSGNGAAGPGSAGDARSQASAPTGTGVTRSPQPGVVAPVNYLKPAAGPSGNVTPSKSPRFEPSGPPVSVRATVSSSASSSDTATAGPTPPRRTTPAASPSLTPTPTPTPSPSPVPTSS